ncbi:hypothetical protein EYR40_000044 [Pleurotus pulmonarius]|nr:hypothetical protein EYR36_008458 [Pleurotus pulmonarius]KAF4579780.1 hypothetical protein EYR36_001599 [Pleurotus pulmonarius]KAF4607709.1 hypothetical protein EYR40_000044 [Pleurotus pulmonarius]
MFNIEPRDKDLKNAITALTTAKECVIDNVETYIAYEEGRIVYLEKEFNQNQAVIQSLQNQLHAAKDMNDRLVHTISEQQSSYESTISQCDNLHQEIERVDSELDVLRMQIPGHSSKA